MSDQTSDIIDQSKFAAREYVAGLERGLGEKLPDFLGERVLFAFEMGYLRGRTDAAHALIEQMAEVTKTQEEAHAILLEALAMRPKDP